MKTKATATEAVIYCRVSSLKQATSGDGLRSQETRCREYAAYKEYPVLEVFCDDVSGSLTRRPGMSAMLDYIRGRRAKGTVVIIDDVSRLARGLEAHLELRRSILGAGGRLESPSIEFGEDSDSRLVENLLATVSDHHRLKNGEQTLNRMRARIQNGYWVFQAPWGYRYERSGTRGKVLKRDGVLADVIQEALEGYASGRFETQADVMRFFQQTPLFPKDKRGLVRHQRVSFLLANPVYAGLVEAPNWGVESRQGVHEPLISLATHKRIKDRLAGVGYAPRQVNLNEDFPLRGFVMCADCGTPLTACWSKGQLKRYPYYLCPKRGCQSYGKSVRREKIEGEFAALLSSVQPSASLMKVATRLFKDLWTRRMDQGEREAKALLDHLRGLEEQVDQLLDRVVEASEPRVIAAFERKISALEGEKLLTREKLDHSGKPTRPFDETLRTALEFLANPWSLWASGQLEDKRAVLKMVFARPLVYERENGLRTANLSLPFKVLQDFTGGSSRMARPKRFELLTPRFVV